MTDECVCGGLREMDGDRGQGTEDNISKGRMTTYIYKASTS